MSAPKSIDVESLIAQTREALDHPIPPPWPDAKKVMAFLCDAMEALVGEVRSADRAADALKTSLTLATALLDEARVYVRHVAGDESLDEHGACVTTLARMDQFLKEAM